MSATDPVSRVYLAVPLTALDLLRSTKVLPTTEMQAFAVTSDLRAELPAGADAEEGEFVALQQAALAAAQSGDHVVAAADVDASTVQPLLAGGGSSGQVRLEGDVPLRHIPSLHVLDPVEQRGADSQLELSWFDITEIDIVLSEIRSRR